MCVDCKSKAIDSLVVQELPGCDCKSKDVYVPKVRFSIEVETEAAPLEGAAKLSELVQVLATVQNVSIKGYHVNIW